MRTRNHRAFQRSITFLLASVSLLIAACSDNGTGPVPVEISSLELLDRSDGSLVAETHGSGSGIHWHGHLHLHHGDEVAITPRFITGGGHRSRSGESIRSRLGSLPGPPQGSSLSLPTEITLTSRPWEKVK